MEMGSPFRRSYSFSKFTVTTIAIGFGVFLATPTESVHAASSVTEVTDFTIHQHFVSARALGMGNAFTAVADDYAAIFYNPAGLARLEEGNLNLELRAGIDTNLPKLYSDINEKSKGNDPTQMADLLNSNYGQHYSARLPTLGSYYVRPGWGIAIIPVDLSLEMEIHQLAGATLDMVATQDTTIAFARGWDVNWGEGQRVSLGFTGKAIYRGYYNRAFLASELMLDSQMLRPEDAAEGFTFDGDLGMLWTPDVKDTKFQKLRPTVGFTIRNIADYGFKSNFHWINQATTKEPAKLQRRFDLGTKFELPDWWIWKTRLMFDVRDMGHDNWTVKKGTHLGAEFLWKIRSWWQGGWRVGLNQGYFTAGFTGLFGIFQADLATYAEEVGPSTASKSNRRWMLKLALDF
jgi:hypothetical protein